MRKIITFTTVFLLTASAFGAGEVYRWRGADGSWHYSDLPRPGAELVVGSGRQRPAPEPQQEESAATPSSVVGIASDDIPVSDAVADEVRSAAAAAKSEQCKQAESSYQNVLRARAIRKVDAEGKPLVDAQGKAVFMSNAEIDAERLQVRGYRDLACGSGA